MPSTNYNVQRARLLMGKGSEWPNVGTLEVQKLMLLECQPKSTEAKFAGRAASLLPSCSSHASAQPPFAPGSSHNPLFHKRYPPANFTASPNLSCCRLAPATHDSATRTPLFDLHIRPLLYLRDHLPTPSPLEFERSTNRIPYPLHSRTKLWRWLFENTLPWYCWFVQPILTIS